MNLSAMTAIGTSSWPLKSSSLILTDTSASASNRANLKEAVNWPSFKRRWIFARNSIFSVGLGGHRLLLPVGRVVGNHPPDATTGVRHIAVPAGNDVHVGVLDGLTCGQAVIEANVEAIWRFQSGEQPLAHLSHQLPDGLLLMHLQLVG